MVKENDFCVLKEERKCVSKSNKRGNGVYDTTSWTSLK